MNMFSCSRLHLCLNHILSHERSQHFGNEYRTILLLIQFQNRDQRPTNRDCRTIERVNKLRSLFPFDFIPSVQSPCLIVRTIRGTRNFAVLTGFTATGHPRFQIELPICRSAEIARRRIDHLIRNAQTIENLTFQIILLPKSNMLQ